MTKILVTDFDNTFFTTNDYSKNIESVNNFADNNNVFIIATGRHINSLLSSIGRCNLNYKYLICNDGGIIFNRDLEILYQKDIPLYIVKPISDIFEEADHLKDWFIDTGLTIIKDKNSSANGIIGEITDKDKAQQLLNLITIKYPDVHGYLSNSNINITEKTVSKQKAIEWLMKKEHWEKEDIYTIGDNINDISMSVYNSYCMKNSILELKRICKKDYNAVYEMIKDIEEGNI